MAVVAIGGTHADNSSQTALNQVLLVRMEPRRRTVAWGIDIVRYGIGILNLSVVASRSGCRDASVKRRLKHLAIEAASPYARFAERQTDDIGTMRKGKLHTFNQLCIRAFAFGTQHLEGHNLSSWSHTGLCARIALTRHNAGGVRAVSVVIHRVVILIIDVVAMMRELAAAIPHAVDDVDMVVVDARVDKGHHNAVTRIARSIVVPHGRRVHLFDMPCQFFGCHRARPLPLGNHGPFLVQDNPCHIATLGQLTDDLGIGLAAKAIERPERLHLGNETLILIAVEEIQHLALRVLAKSLSVADDESTALGFGHHLGRVLHTHLVVLLGHAHQDGIKLFVGIGLDSVL